MIADNLILTLANVIFSKRNKELVQAYQLKHGRPPNIANASAKAATLNGWDFMQTHFLKSQQKGWKRIYAAALKRQMRKQ